MRKLTLLTAILLGVLLPEMTYSQRPYSTRYNCRWHIEKLWKTASRDTQRISEDRLDILKSAFIIDTSEFEQILRCGDYEIITFSYPFTSTGKDYQRECNDRTLIIIWNSRVIFYREDGYVDYYGWTATNRRPFIDLEDPKVQTAYLEFASQISQHYLKEIAYSP